MIWKAKDLTEWSDFALSKDGQWKPARPINYQCDSLRDRLKSALLVLSGKCDVLDWEED